MNSQDLFERIHKHLLSIYGMSMHSNLLDARCILLVRLYVAIQDYVLLNPIPGLSCREAIIHMVYKDSGVTMRNLNQIPASLTLCILEPRIHASGMNLSDNFLCFESGMAQQIEESRAHSAKSPGNTANLPELRWCDLPSDLFPCIAEN